MNEKDTTSTDTLIAACRELADTVQSGDGVANAALHQVADRLAELSKPLDIVVATQTGGCEALYVNGSLYIEDMTIYGSTIDEAIDALGVGENANLIRFAHRSVVCEVWPEKLEHLPDEDDVGGWIACKACKGEGEAEYGGPCPTCHGVGLVPPKDADAEGGGRDV